MLYVCLSGKSSNIRVNVRGLPVVQAFATWSRDVHTAAEEARQNLPFQDSVLDDREDFMRRHSSVPHADTIRRMNLHTRFR